MMQVNIYPLLAAVQWGQVERVVSGQPAVSVWPANFPQIESTSKFLLSFVKYGYDSPDKDIQKQKYGFQGQLWQLRVTIIILLM